MLLITTIPGNMRLSEATSFRESSSALAPKWTIEGLSSRAHEAIKEMSQVRNSAENFDGGTIAAPMSEAAEIGSSRGHCNTPAVVQTRQRYPRPRFFTQLQ